MSDHQYGFRDLPAFVIEDIAAFAVTAATDNTRLRLVTRAWHDAVDASQCIPAQLARVAFGRERAPRHMPWARLRHYVARARLLRPNPIGSLRAIEDCPTADDCPCFAEHLTLRESADPAAHRQPLSLACAVCMRDVVMRDKPPRRVNPERPEPWMPAAVPGAPPVLRRLRLMTHYTTLVFHICRDEDDAAPVQRLFSHIRALQHTVPGAWNHPEKASPSGRPSFRYMAGSCAHPYELIPVRLCPDSKSGQYALAEPLKLESFQHLAFVALVLSADDKAHMSAAALEQLVTVVATVGTAHRPDVRWAGVENCNVGAAIVPCAAAAKAVTDSLEAWCGSETFDAEESCGSSGGSSGSEESDS